MTKLTPSEEAAILGHVLDLDERKFLPTKVFPCSKADKLLDAREDKSTQVCWLPNSIERTLEFKAK